jgi:fatty acid desaturase
MGTAMHAAAQVGSMLPAASMEQTAIDWKRGMTPEQRATVTAWHQLTPWTTGKIPVVLTIWIGCALIAINVDLLWVQIPCWLIIGFVLHGLGVFMHEAAHRSLFRRPWLDRIVGFVCGLPVAFSCSSYRATHLLHHQYENTEHDPDNLTANFKTPHARAAIYYLWLVIGMPMYILLTTLTGPFRARRWKEKVACVIEPILIVAFFVALFTLASKYDFGHIVADGWGWALPFAIVIGNLRGLAEHTQLLHDDPPDPFHSTRSLISNWFVSFFFNNQNYHLEHHLFPSVPWNNLPKVHRLMQPVYDVHRASVTRGYMEWLLGAFRYGPNRTVSYINQRTYPDPPRGTA